MMISKKLINTFWLLGALVIVLGLTSCGVIEPEDSKEKSNQLPETVITSGPRENSTNSYFVRIAWKGEDSDGLVRGFNLVVDSSPAKFVTITDSTFRFSAPNQDTKHTVAVAAVDDKGGVDPTPATLTFSATNVPPNTKLEIAGNPAQGATFGRGGIFTIVAYEDPDNGPEFSYRFKIDNDPWSEWQAEGVVEYSLTSKLGLLPVGQHTFFAQTRDQAMAVDETPAEFRFVVSAEVKPRVGLTAQYNGAAFYEDNSAFAFPSRDSVTFSWSPIFDYAGAMSTGSRYRVDSGAWTEYSTTIASLSLIDVSPGKHTFEVQYRDLAGTEGEVAKFSYEIFTPTFADGILVVDDGDGPFAGRQPTGDANVDNFYTEVLTVLGTRFTLWDVKSQGRLTPGRGLGRYAMLIWESDEGGVATLLNQTKQVSEYLVLGGKLWVSGWRMLFQLAATTPVSNFNPAIPNQPAIYSFIWNYLKIASLRQTPGTPPDFTGATGLAGHPNISIDPAKDFVPPLNQDRIAPVDMFEVRSDVPQAQSIYTYVSSSGNVDYQGKTTGMKYLGNDFKVVFLGFPLFNIKTTEAIEAARKILTDFGVL